MADSFIVGDAGGTGTQWRVVKNGDIQQYETVGFNAYTHNLEELKESIIASFGNEIESGIPVYFYAAGIDTVQQSKEVQNSLSALFGSHVQAYNDLVGVARSLCGKEEGNVCILGTGANACYYDGEKVNKVSASLGYVLGDEGSGAYMGKKLMMRVFREQLSKEVIDLFQEKYHLTSHKVIQRIYHQPQPNHFLASFSTFIHEHRNKPEIYQLITDAFNDFFEAFYQNSDKVDKPFYFSGSIAYFFSDLLRQVGNERGILIKNIVQSPIAGLVLYHQQYD